jgi:hypothetical protein
VCEAGALDFAVGFAGTALGFGAGALVFLVSWGPPEARAGTAVTRRSRTDFRRILLLLLLRFIASLLLIILAEY